MVASVFDSVTALSKFLKCSRRQDATNSPQSQKRAAGHSARKKHATKWDDSDDAEKSTDVGVSSAISGEGSTDGSDVDSPIFSNKAANKNVLPPPGLVAPPGLGAPPGLEEARQAPPWHKGGRQSSGLDALRDAISNLTPQDAAMVQSLLRAKEQGQMETGRHNPPWARSYEAGTKPMSRPFTPYHPREHPLSKGDPRVAKPSVRPWKPEKTLDDNDTLKANLRDLAAMDQAKVLLVRKINRLGLDSQPALESYFSKFGATERLMVSHTRSKASADGKCRIRPATVGFVVMSEASAAQAVLAQGQEHVVNGVTVSVSTFESHPID